MSEAKPSILQFGVGRFLLGHVDALISDSLAWGESEQRIMAVQGSPRPEGREKARQLMAQPHYPLHIRGRQAGREIDECQRIKSVAGCLIADEQWPELERLFVEATTHVVSNTADRGFEIPEGDSPLHDLPASFPCRLIRLLHTRYLAGGAGVTLLPCELIPQNGRVLQALMRSLATRFYADPAFERWLDERCLWVDTLVDRIVSAPLEPIGAVAEPYALWAIRQVPGLEMPCRHPAIRVVDDLTPFEQQKLHILNLSHSWLVDQWRTQALEGEVTFVREAMADPRLRGSLEALLDEEVLPVLQAASPELDHVAYRAQAFERFENPFLDHRLADIAANHEEKLKRRLSPLLALADTHGLAVPKLRAGLAGR
ncbi:mannitol dehydrogenase [Kushneria phosphatilytica]|uniref:mannitol dehydrogenase family protein n=1 Tax=Kushneria phosphatilytica TaxID=657387 RepID=UPI0008D94A30|nr:mannitol dehydrogenase [Kushneria phosphatilytica]OHV08027.1 mannitol dehydrogenase [Kushneria phosphatilytica]